jgi:hypothetical protein
MIIKELCSRKGWNEYCKRRDAEDKKIAEILREEFDRCRQVVVKVYGRKLYTKKKRK